MIKVLFTESQMRQILNKVGLNEWSDVSSGYLDQNSTGTEAPSIVNGSQVSVNPINPDDIEQEKATTTDDVADMQSKKGRGFGPRGLSTMSPISLEEDIEQQVFRASDKQKKQAQLGGTKMGSNIANEKKTSNATQRQRKHRLEQQKLKLPKEIYDQKYGDIEKTVKNSLKQMSNVNDVITNTTDSYKLVNANDAGKVKNTTNKGHHDGEKLSNGTLHYFK